MGIQSVFRFLNINVFEIILVHINIKWNMLVLFLCEAFILCPSKHLLPLILLFFFKTPLELFNTLFK